jgi:hypothetical protein
MNDEDKDTLLGILLLLVEYVWVMFLCAGGLYLLYLLLK